MQTLGPFHADPSRRPDFCIGEFAELYAIKQRAVRGMCTQNDLARWADLEPFRVEVGPAPHGERPMLYLAFQPTKTSNAQYASGCFCPQRWQQGQHDEAQRMADWLSCLYRTHVRNKLNHIVQLTGLPNGAIGPLDAIREAATHL